MIARREDWPERLVEALALAEEPRDDSYPCVVWAADCVLAMTGTDLLPERGATAAACYARMREQGFLTVRDALAAKLEEVPLALARRGDVVLASGEVDSVGICFGERTAFVALGGGVTFRPTLGQAAAFRVPFGE